MDYYIYRNWVAEKKAVIHRSECGMCNNGKGCHENALGNKNGEWSKRLKSFKDAENDAKKSYNRKRLKLKYCKICKPQIS